jgi:hypothetical protein
MRVTCVFHLISALQGGASMSLHRISHDVQVAPAQVWPALSPDLQTRITCLLAQLALNIVATRPASVCTGKEVTYVQPTRSAKNLS